MIADILDNEKLNPRVTESFIRDRRLTISVAFITQSDFSAPKNVILNSTHYFLLKIANFNKFHLIIHLILALQIL